MRSVTGEVDRGLERLADEMELHRLTETMLKGEFKSNDKKLRAYSARAGRSIHVNVLVGCYGLLEEAVDLILMEAATRFALVYDKHAEIPDVVRQQHRDVLLACLRDGARARTRRKVSEGEALRSFGRAGGDSVSLLPAAFTLSTANYRAPYVESLFDRLAINVRQGPGWSVVGPALGRLGYASVTSFLEDLVERRNELAHSATLGGTLSPSLLGAYIELTGLYVRYLVDAVRHHLAGLAIASEKIRPIGVVDTVYAVPQVLGVPMQSGFVAVGSRLLVYKQSKSVIATVVSMQSSGKNLDCAEGGPSSPQVGFKVDVSTDPWRNAAVYVVPRSLSRTLFD